MENIIEVRSLMKAFGNQVALDDVDFSVRKKEIFGFLGPSGSGKTTTIKILTDQLSPTDGVATVFGIPSHRLTKEGAHRRIGILTDNSGLYNRLSIYDNLKLYCKLYDAPFSRIHDVLEVVNLIDEQKKIVSRLSKGMLQRVILARALLHKPDLLFLDEPTSALDPANSRHIYNGLRELNNEGTTIFLTTHDMSEAEHLCDRVAFLHKGKIQLLDEPKKIRRQFSDSSITVELNDGRRVVMKNGPEDAVRMHEYMTSSQVASIYSNEPTLGDIFVDVTGRELI
ncbi:ABC transporter ATP-binding protein [Alkalihalobacillus sp. R86527]|uniref:ABC transporter ATP-binding protein n=1 Tax=Alkalihalobacillus sp. R86527 TaxID=3093863 RepID=UPI003670388B